MRIPNYLLKIIENLNDTSIRIFGVEELIRKMWTRLKNKKLLLVKWKIPKSTMKNYIRGNRGIPISVCYKIVKEYCKETNTNSRKLWDKIYSKVVQFKSESSGSKPIKLPKELTKDLAYFVGALRDGCLATFSGNPNHFGVLMTQESNPKWLKETIIPIVRKLFDLNPIPRKEIQIYNKPLFKFFEKLFEMPPGNQAEWSTPQLIKQAPLNLQVSYIRGFFDAEGTCIPTEPLIGFFQKNKSSLRFIKNKLKELNIKSGSILPDRNIWRFWISEKRSVKLFIEKIGTSHQEKLNRFNKTLIAV